MPRIVNGLARRTPWAGIDRETVDEFYLSAAATVSRLAEAGERDDWRTPGHLERAVIAAFRHEALTHWKAVNAQKRRGDRDAAPFDPERDAPTYDPLNRIYEPDPREGLVARDWLVQLRGDVREFWKPVILEGVEYKEAGDRLGLNKAERQAMYREGIEHLGRFRRLLDEGRVCQLRAPAIAAYRAGKADAVTAERARAHLACCLPCALVHDAGASALKRGILHALPWAAVGRAVAWVRELPTGRAAETAGAGGALLFGKGVAVLCAGAVAAGACATGFGLLPMPLRTDAPHQEERRVALARAPRAKQPVDASANSTGSAISASAPPPPTTTGATASTAASAPPTTSGPVTGRSASDRSSTAVDRLDPFVTEFDFEGAVARTAPPHADRVATQHRPVAAVAGHRTATNRKPTSARREALPAGSDRVRPGGSGGRDVAGVQLAELQLGSHDGTLVSADRIVGVDELRVVRGTVGRERVDLVVVLRRRIVIRCSIVIEPEGGVRSAMTQPTFSTSNAARRASGTSVLAWAIILAVFVGVFASNPSIVAAETVTTSQARVAAAEFLRRPTRAGSSSRDEIDRYIQRFVEQPNWRAALERFGAFGPPVAEPDQKPDRKSSLSRIFPTQVLGSQGSLLFGAFDEEGHDRLDVSRDDALRIRIWATFAVAVLETVRDRFGTPQRDELVDFFTTELIDAAIAARLADALLRFFDGDDDAALHIVIPQLEATIRSAAARVRIVVIKNPQGARPGGVRQLGALLADLRGRMDEAWRRYLVNALNDSRGVNLRDQVSHGLYGPVSRADIAIALHIALHLRLWQVGDERPEE